MRSAAGLPPVPVDGVQRTGNRRVAPRARGAAPAGGAPGMPVGRPTVVRGCEPAVAAPHVVLIPRDAGDASALARASGRKLLDVRATAGSTADRTARSNAHRAVGTRESTVGVSASRWRTEGLGVIVLATTVKKVLREEQLDPLESGPTRRGASSCARTRRACLRWISSRSTRTGSSVCTCCSSSKSPAATCTWPAVRLIPTASGSPSTHGRWHGRSGGAGSFSDSRP